ncbi:unnamed protein product [Nippostrongylus brasiliensis]|uniref:Recombinase domain-containing protein n=1 Tax=Nippostrongylus brasiliensis TaxID=27835 RepID=A0A0N4YXS4_NIPBR|nr:unnamed protein product [Nippostrongylus brasiliensis]
MSYTGRKGLRDAKDMICNKLKGGQGFYLGYDMGKDITRPGRKGTKRREAEATRRNKPREMVYGKRFRRSVDVTDTMEAIRDCERFR